MQAAGARGLLGIYEGLGNVEKGAGLSLWEDEELDETDEAEDQQGTGNIGSKSGIHLP